MENVVNAEKGQFNKGFSLVELLISVSILTVASLALMKAFSVATFTNKSTQNMQNATSLAESTMDEIKRLKLEKLEEIYGGGSGNFSENLDYTSASLIDDLKDACESGSDGLIKIVGRDVTDADKFPYYILYQDEVTATQGQKYHVIATIKSKPYANTSSTLADSINAKQLPKIEDLDQAEQAVLSTEINQYDESAIKDLKSQYGDSKLPTDLENNVKKTITITIQDGIATDYTADSVTPTADSINIDCQVEYKYENGSNSKSVGYSTYMGTFSNASGGDIYLFYNYSGLGKDNIRIIDKSAVVADVSHDVYFIEQDDPNTKVVTLGTEFDIYMENRSANNSTHSFTNTDFVESDGRKNTLHTNLYDTGSNSSPAATQPKGHIYKEEANKNNIYEIEITVIDTKGEICASMKSTKSGDIE